MDITRRDLFKMAGVAVLGAAVGQFTTQPVEAAKRVLKLKAAPVVGSKNVTGTKYTGTAAKVYFTDKLDAAHLIKLYNMINGEIIGKVVSARLESSSTRANRTVRIFCRVIGCKNFKHKFPTAILSKRIRCTPDRE